MTKIRIEVTILRDPGVVFKHLTDPSKMKAWMDDLVRATSSEELAVDGPYTQTLRIGRGEETLSGKVIELVKNERFVFTLSASFAFVQTHFELVSEGRGKTRLILHEAIAPKGVIAKLITPLVKNEAKAERATELKRLKAHLEQTAEGASDKLR